jgi:hypothetical protein
LARLHVREDQWRARQPQVDYVVDRAGLQYGVARAKLVAAWKFDLAKPSLAGLKKIAQHQKIILTAQKEFAGVVEGQAEVAGPHLQQLNTKSRTDCVTGPTVRERVPRAS